MRRVLTAAAALSLLILPGAFTPARAAAPELTCVADPQADVTSVVKGEVQPDPVAAPKADLRRFCAGMNNRIHLRFRVPGVDPTMDPVWNAGVQHAYVLAGFDTPGGGGLDYLIGVAGPFTDGRFLVIVVQDIDDDGQFEDQSCDNAGATYDAVNKVIRASLPASCLGSPSTFEAFGQSYRNPDMATFAKYLFDDSEPVVVLSGS